MNVPFLVSGVRRGQVCPQSAAGEMPGIAGSNSVFLGNQDASVNDVVSGYRIAEEYRLPRIDCHGTNGDHTANTYWCPCWDVQGFTGSYACCNYTRGSAHQRCDCTKNPPCSAYP